MTDKYWAPVAFEELMAGFEEPRMMTDEEFEEMDEAPAEMTNEEFEAMDEESEPETDELPAPPGGAEYRLTRRMLTLILTFSLLLLNAVAGTLAFIEYRTPAIVNTFTAAGAPEPVIVEDFTEGGTVKSNVKVRLEEGTGAYYIRAAVVVTLLNDDGTTAAIIPQEDVDYSITMGSGWTQKGDYWYYNSAVLAGGSTTNLIESCTTLNSQYQLVVDVLAQTIQANPASAASDEWGFSA